MTLATPAWTAAQHSLLPVPGRQHVLASRVAGAALGHWDKPSPQSADKSREERSAAPPNYGATGRPALRHAATIDAAAVLVNAPGVVADWHVARAWTPHWSICWAPVAAGIVAYAAVRRAGPGGEE